MNKPTKTDPVTELFQELTKLVVEYTKKFDAILADMKRVKS
jgi:hypothetical protein